MAVWDSKGAKVFIQPYGPGNPFYFTDIETDMEAISGGSLSFQSDYSGDDYVSSRRTSNPGDVTGTLNARHYDVASTLRDLADGGCYHGILAANGCTTLDVADFNSAIYMTDAAFTAKMNVSAKLIDRTVGDNPKVMDTLPFRAAKAQEWRRLGSSRIGSIGGVIQAPSRIISAGSKNCPGCGGPVNDGNQEFISISPITASLPRIYYTGNGGSTWKNIQVTSMINVTTTDDVTKIGDSILIAVSTGVGNGIWRLSYATLKDAATTATITATKSVSGAFTRVLAVGNSVYACGNGGIVYISKDRGYTFTQLNHGLTANNLLSIAGRDENLVVFGGTSGEVLVYQNTVFALKNSGVASNITAIAIPPRITDEVYVGHVNGTIYRSRDSRVTWEQVQLPSTAGQISQLTFVGERGALLFILRVSGSDTEILVDRSGGAGGAAVAQVRAVVTPDVFSIAMTSPNFGLALCEIVSSNIVVERISG